MNCICCGNDSFSIKQKTSFFNIPVYRCNECSLHTTGIDKDMPEVHRLYEKQYWDERNVRLQTDYEDIESLGRYRTWLSQYKYCKDIIGQKKTILEIGAGQGQASFWFEEKGFIVTALEPDKRNGQIIRSKLKKGNVIVRFVEEFSTDKKFDLIWMNHVLEHLERPDKFLVAAKEWLAEKGVFFIEVPNCDNPDVLESSINEPHLYHFTESTLTNILKNCGYNVVSYSFFRPARRIEGVLNKILKKHFPYYPRIQTDKKYGKDLRYIISKK